MVLGDYDRMCDKVLKLKIFEYLGVDFGGSKRFSSGLVFWIVENGVVMFFL